MSEISYTDKADLIVDTTIDDMFKVTASDMNEIKSVVNTNASTLDATNTNIGTLSNLTTTDKTSIVNAINEINVSSKVLWTGRATSVDIDLTGYSLIEVIFCSNDNFYNSLKVPVSGSTFSRALALCNSYLSDPMSSGGMLYLKYGKATLTQSGITIKSNVEVAISNTASQIKWSGSGNTLLYITTIIGYK